LHVVEIEEFKTKNVQIFQRVAKKNQKELNLIKLLSYSKTKFYRSVLFLDISLEYDFNVNFNV